MRWYSIWDNNPRFARPEATGDFNLFLPRERGLRPYAAMKTAERWTWKPYRPPRGEFYFMPHEKAYGNLNAGLIICDPTIKSKASVNKQWGVERWNALSLALLKEGLQFTQIGPRPEGRANGAAFKQTVTIREAAVLISRAKLVVCHEGALHHIAAAVGTPAIVLYGGYISPEVTGYDGQVALFTGEGLGCGWRTTCEHCAAAMARIKPEMVIEKIKEVLCRDTKTVTPSAA